MLNSFSELYDKLIWKTVFLQDNKSILLRYINKHYTPNEVVAKDSIHKEVLDEIEKRTINKWRDPSCESCRENEVLFEEIENIINKHRGNH